MTAQILQFPVQWKRRSIEEIIRECTELSGTEAVDVKKSHWFPDEGSAV